MNKTLSALTIAIAALFLISCGKDQVKTDATGPAAAFVKASNSQLAKYPIGGFAYKDSVLPAQQWEKWAKVASPIVRDILTKVPDGYALEEIGRAHV